MATYTYQQLQQISAERQAAYGVLYNCDDGRVYVGIKSGRLELNTKATNVIVNDDSSQVNLQAEIDNKPANLEKVSFVNSMLLMGG